MTTDTKNGLPKVGDTVYYHGYGPKLPDGRPVSIELSVVKVTDTTFTTDDGRGIKGVSTRRWKYGRMNPGYSAPTAFAEHGGDTYVFTLPPSQTWGSDENVVMTATEYYAIKDAAANAKVAAEDAARKAKFERLGVGGYLRDLVHNSAGSSTFTTETRRLRAMVGDDEAFMSELMYALAEAASYRSHLKGMVNGLKRYVEEN